MRLVGEVGPQGRQGRNQREVGPEGQQGRNQREVGAEGWHVRTQIIKDQGSRIKDECGRLDLEAGTSGPRGSRIKDQRPCFGTNEHPRRDTNVILRQSIAPLELFNS